MSANNQLSINNHQQINSSNNINDKLNNDNPIKQSNQINNQIDNQINQQSNHQLNGNQNMDKSSQILKENEVTSKIKETNSLSNSINKQYSNGHNDSLSEASFSDDKSTDDKIDNELNDLFPNIIFTLKEVFRLSVKFTKDNENKAFFPTYDDRNGLYALNYQIRYGPFVEEDSPKLGALDFVGKDRRLAWKSLGNLSKEAAMVKFIKELNRICPIYKPYIEAHNQEKVEREKFLREEEEKKRIEEEEKLRKLEEKRKEQEELELKERKKQELREALKKQTYVQFKSYAQQQYPNDLIAQENLIKTLEDNHFQQFIQQQMQFQEQNRLNQMNPAASNQQDELINRMQQFNLNGDRADNTNLNNFDNKFQQQKQEDYLHNYVNQEEEEDEEFENEEESNNEDEEESESEIEYDNNYEGKRIEVLKPQMWTKKVIKQFKEAISIDNGDGIVKIGYGESLTIRVPTHPGRKMYSLGICN